MPGRLRPPSPGLSSIVSTAAIRERLLEGLNPEQREAVIHHRGPAARARRRGQRQDARAHAADRLPGRRVRHRARGHPRGHVHEQGRRRDARARREAARRRARASGSRPSTRAACGSCAATSGTLGYTRGFAIYDEADSLAAREARSRASTRPEAAPRRARSRADLDGKNAAARRRRLPPRRAARLRADGRPTSTPPISAARRDANALDFDDLLVRTVELFERFPEVLAHYRRRCQYVLVDEYQDTNRVQYRLVHQLVAEHRNLCVVGDATSRSTAGAAPTSSNILDFERDFPERSVVKLERNYRSTQPILRRADAVVEHNRAPAPKALCTDARRGRARSACRARGRPRRGAARGARDRAARAEEGGSHGDCAVFYRTNAQSRVFEEELRRYDVPLRVVGGVRFYDRAEVKDALAYLRLLVNPQDVVAFAGSSTRPRAGSARPRSGADRRARPSTLGEAVWEVRAGAEEIRASGAAPIKAVGRFMSHDGAAARSWMGTRVGRRPARSRCSTTPATCEALEAERTIEAEGRIENLRELRQRRRASTNATAERARARAVPRPGRARLRRRTT